MRRVARGLLLLSLLAPYAPLCRAAGHEGAGHRRAGAADPDAGAPHHETDAHRSAAAAVRHDARPALDAARAPSPDAADCHALMGCGPTIVAVSRRVEGRWAALSPHSAEVPVVDDRHPAPTPVPRAPPPRAA